MNLKNESGGASPEQTLDKKRHKIIFAGVDIEDQVRDAAEEKLTASKEELGGITGFFKKIWKHNLAREYYRQKFIAKTRREIRESGNLYAGEGGTKADHENAMKEILARFEAEYDSDETLRAGEERKILKDEVAEEKVVKNVLQDLVKRYAAGNITEEQLVLEKNKFLDGEVGSIQGKEGEALFKKGSLYADNFLEIAKQIKSNISHGNGLDALDLDFDIVVGRARSGVETQAQYNAVDKITEKIQKSFIGRFANETSIASAVAMVYGVAVKGSVSAAQRTAKWVGPVGLGLSAGIGGAVAGIRESKQLKDERAQHIREMAKGKKIEVGSEKREEMEKFRYETKDAGELTQGLKESLDSLKSAPNKEKLVEVLERINEIDSRISFSEREKIDLISFSDSKKVEQQRTRMYILTAEAKAFLKENIGKDWAGLYKTEQELKNYLANLKEEKIQSEFKNEKTLKDEAFDKMRRRKVAGAVIKGTAIGIGVGIVAQEALASLGGSQEGLFTHNNLHANEAVRHFTALEYLRRYISGDMPKTNITEHIVSEKAISVETQKYVEGHEGIFSKIKRIAWADNDSSRPDKNELKLWWGGEKGTGIDKNGNFVFNIKQMAEEGSFHKNAHWDPQNLMKEGKMKLLISLSQDTQNNVVEIPIDADGNAIIDPHSEIGKIAFKNAGGQANFLGRFAEVAVMKENKGGAGMVDIIATHEGKGLDSVADIQPEYTDKITEIPAQSDVDWPYAIPVLGRRPLEKLKDKKSEKPKGVVLPPKKGEKKKEEKIKEKEEKISPETAKIEPVTAATVAAAGAAVAETASGERKTGTKEETAGVGVKEDGTHQKAPAKTPVKKPAVAPVPAGEEPKILEEKEHPARAAAWHTIRKLEDSSENLTYADIGGKTEGEGEQKFVELTRRLWNELSVHGRTEINPVTKEVKIKSETDQDGRSCLKLMELAGILVDPSKIKFVEQGTFSESGITMDTANKDGVIAEEDGKRLVFDHHGGKSGRDTSATKHVYETLIALGLLKKEPYLDKFVEFVTKCDNENFTDEEYKKIFENFHRNLYGLRDKISVENILEFFKKGGDPTKILPRNYLDRIKITDPKTKKERTLVQVSAELKKQKESAEKTIKKMESEGFFVDTGDKRFGKVLIDTRKKKADGRWFPKIPRMANVGRLAVRVRGFGGYLIWSPSENSFVLYTKKKIDENSVPGGFSQGFNVRGNMWLKPEKDMAPLTITLEEVLSKLAGRDFKIEGRLQEALVKEEQARKEEEEKAKQAAQKAQVVAPEAPAQTPAPEAIAPPEKVAEPPKKMDEKQEKISESVKKMGELFSNFELLYDAIKEEAANIQVAPAELAVQFINGNGELRSQFEEKKGSVDLNDKKAIEKLAMTLILEEERKKVEEKIKSEGESDNLRIALRDIKANLLRIKIVMGLS